MRTHAALRLLGLSSALALGPIGCSPDTPGNAAGAGGSGPATGAQASPGRVVPDNPATAKTRVAAAGAR